jgi:cell division protein FtsI (penicillin-binding protein 3)
VNQNNNRKPRFPITLEDRKRLVILAIILFSLFSVLIAQFYKIQIIEGEKWTWVGRKQHFFIVKEPFQRGTFYSNTSIKLGHPEKPQPLVLDIQKFHLYIDPESIPVDYRDEAADKLSTLLDLAEEERGELRAQFEKKSRSRKLAMWLDTETRDMINSWWRGYAQPRKIPRNALFFVNDYQRSYPFGKLLGQVLHTIQGNKDEKTHQAIPTGGLELYFNKYLKGKQGRRLLMRSPRNSFELGTLIEAPQNGADIYLTVNHFLQAIAEEELAKGVKKARAKAGWAVMMEPRTGEILALAQYPFFYPPDYQQFFNDPELIEHTKVKAVTDANEPGSIMKPITLAIALKANEELRKQGRKPLFDPDEKIDTANTHFKGRRKPLKDLHPHSFLNMNMALQKSSNVYMARLIERTIDTFGDQWYRDLLYNTFKFGQKTLIELPAESSGLLPTPGKKHPNGALEWSPPTPYSLAIGHNIQANTIQMLRAYALFANGGYIVDPTLVRKIVKTDPEGNQIVLVDNTVPERTAAFPQLLDSDTIALLAKALKYPTKAGGAAPRANVPGFTEAGKTGTAEKIVNGFYAKDKNCSSFIGFAPAENSAFLLIVVMDEPEVAFIPGVGKNTLGGTCCAPVFREIAKRSLEYLGREPDDPYGYPVGDPRYNAEKADWVKETRLLKEMYEKWNKK